MRREEINKDLLDDLLKFLKWNIDQEKFYFESKKNFFKMSQHILWVGPKELNNIY